MRAYTKITRLTFDYNSLFTIATDQDGNTYRVLYACVSGGGRAYYLSAWVAEGIPTWRGRTIKEGHSLYPVVDAAEEVRRQAERDKPIDPKAYERFMAETI